MTPVDIGDVLIVVGILAAVVLFLNCLALFEYRLGRRYVDADRDRRKVDLYLFAESLRCSKKGEGRQA